MHKQYFGDEKSRVIMLKVVSWSDKVYIPSTNIEIEFKDHVPHWLCLESQP